MDSTTPVSATPPAPIRTVFIDLAVLLLAGLAFWMFHLNYRGLWEDEFLTLNAVRQPLVGLIENRLSAGHFPTYFILLKAWTEIAGISEWSMRLPSVLLALGSVPFVYGFCRRAWGREAALWAGAFTILHQRMLWSAQEARPYALLLFAAAASVYFLYCALDRRRGFAGTGWVLGWMLASLLGLFTHATYLFLFVGQVLMVVWVMARRRRADGPLAAAALLTLAAGVAGLVWLGSHRVNRYASERGFLAFKKLADHLGELFAGRFDLLTGSSMKYVFTVLMAAMLVVLWRRRRDEPIARAPLAFGLALNWLIALPAIVYGYSAVGSMIARYGRYYTPAVGAVPVLLALLLVSTPRGRLRRGLAIATVVVLGAFSVAYHGYAEDCIREGIAELNQRRDVNEPLYFVTRHPMDLVMSYYPLEGNYRIIGEDERDAEPLRARFDREIGPNVQRFWLCFYEQPEHPLHKYLDGLFGGQYDAEKVISEDDLRYVEIYRMDRKSQ